MAKKKKTGPDNYKEQLIAEIRKLGCSQGLNTAFTTFLEITATSIGAKMDAQNCRLREERYCEITKDMKPAVLSCYARMFMLLWLEIWKHMDDPCDVLGDIYHQLRLNNEWNGQYFTPDYICRMMAKFVNPVDEHPKKEGPLLINEPTCGSGTMVIGVVWEMQKQHFDFRHKAFFVAQDIDIRCVWMAYIQLSLYGIPAVVIHGNTLTLEEWSHWFTPCAILPFGEDQKEGA